MRPTPAHYMRDNRNLRYSYTATLAMQWLRKNKPVVYRVLRMKALQKYPLPVRNGASNA